jgi:hypothetical protein
MSERPESDSTIKKPDTGTKTGQVVTPPQDHPHTVSPPAKEPPKGPGGGGPDKTPKDPQTSWSGSDRYEDGYVMARQPDGEITLTDPHGRTATWYPDAHGWYDAEGSRMPDGWSAGHAPTTQTYGTGMSTPPNRRP